MKAAYKEIDIQREELQMRNKDITDSLNYARRIQAALLPAEHHIREDFPQLLYLLHARSISSAATSTGSVSETEIISSQPLTAPDTVCPVHSCQ